MRGPGRIYVVRKVRFLMEIAKMSHIVGAHGSQVLRRPSPIIAAEGKGTFFFSNQNVLGNGPL